MFLFYDFKQPQGDFDHNSETNKSYKDNHASRPVIHKLKDHSVDVQPEGSIAKKYVLIHISMGSKLTWSCIWFFIYLYLFTRYFLRQNKT